MKKNFIYILFGLSCLSIEAFAQGIVACYPFSDNAEDVSGNDRNGTVKNAKLTEDRFGNNNSAYYFDGNSYIEIPIDGFLNNSYTFSVWAKSDVVLPRGEYAYIFSIGGNGGDQSLDLSGGANGALGWTFGGYSIGGGRVPFCHQGTYPNINEWQHVVGVRSENQMRLYVNGVLVDTDNTGGLNPYYGVNTKVTIGTRASIRQYFKGKIDDITIYDYAIDKAQVQRLYQDGLGCKPLVATVSTF